METKICNKCEIEKPIEEFYLVKANKDGRRGYCKKCERKCHQDWYYNKDGKEKNLETTKRARAKPEGREADRKYARSDKNARKQKRYSSTQTGRIRGHEACARYRLRYPEKILAHNAVHTAVKAGKLPKPSRCEKCGFKGKLWAHHPDYTFPLQVVWLCFSCHEAEHGKEAHAV